MNAFETEAMVHSLCMQSERLNEALLGWNLEGAWEGPTVSGFAAEWARTCRYVEQLEVTAEKLRHLQVLQAQAAETERWRHHLLTEEAQWKAIATTLGGAW